MRFFDFLFRANRPSSASIAKERLQIIVSHERRRSSTPDFLPRLQKDILEVVRKYIEIDEDQIKLSVDRKGDCEILELNISLANPVGPQPWGRPVRNRGRREAEQSAIRGRCRFRSVDDFTE